MQKFKLPAMRIYELSGTIDSIGAKDMATVKDIRINVGIVSDLQGYVKELVDAYQEYTDLQNTIVSPFRDKFAKESVDLSDEDKKKLTEELDKELKAKMEKEEKKLKPLTDKINELGKVEIECELGDDKMAKLREWVGSKIIIEKYLSKKVYIQICDALGVE